MIGKKKKSVKNLKLNLINDDVNLAKKLNADGCHLGQNDMKIYKVRELIRNKIIGITCYNSIKLARSP